MFSKQEVYHTCFNLLEDKIAALKKSFRDITEEAETDSKSSAGDKHETSRAMMQMEQEKISNRLNRVLEEKVRLEKINTDRQPERIIPGSLIETDKGWFFLAVSLGKVIVSGTPVFVLSPASPLGTRLMGLKAGEAAVINGVTYLVNHLE